MGAIVDFSRWCLKAFFQGGPTVVKFNLPTVVLEKNIFLLKN